LPPESQNSASPYARTARTLIALQRRKHCLAYEQLYKSHGEKAGRGMEEGIACEKVGEKDHGYRAKHTMHPFSQV